MKKTNNSASFYNHKKRTNEPKYLSFEEAREYVCTQNIKNAHAWKTWIRNQGSRYSKNGYIIPTNPHVFYKKQGWTNWDNWLKAAPGQTADAANTYLPFEDAKKYIKKLKLKNTSEWVKLYRGKLEGLTLPSNIPWNPQTIYADEWRGMPDWISSTYVNFITARTFVRRLKLKGQIEWREYCKGTLPGYNKKPRRIPSDPKSIYKDDWISTANWLGTESKRTPTKTNDIEGVWMPYDEARSFVNTLKLSTVADWKLYTKRNRTDLPPLPDDIPKTPEYVYAGVGWTNWSDWLGSEIIIRRKKEQNFEEEGRYVHN